MQRLNAAVYYSTPSVLCILLLYVALPARTFLLASAIGARTSARVRKALSGVAIVVNTVFVASMLIGLSRHCQPHFRYNAIECQEQTVFCAGFQTGVVLALVVLLFVDRTLSAFLLKPIDLSLSWRCTRAAVLGTAYTTVTHDFQSIMVLIGLALLMRYVNVSQSNTKSVQLVATRIAVVYMGIVSIDALWVRDELPPQTNKAYAVALATTTIALFRSR